MLQLLGIDINNSTQTLSWYGKTIPFQPPNLCNGLFTHSIFDLENPEEKVAANAGYKAKTILESEYDAVNARTVVEQQTHFTKEQQDDLCAVFSKYSKLFSGKLDKFPNRKIIQILTTTLHPSVAGRIRFWPSS